MRLFKSVFNKSAEFLENFIGRLLQIATLGKSKLTGLKMSAELKN